MVISWCMVCVEGYHTPRNVTTIIIKNAGSLGQWGGRRTRQTVCTGIDKGPHMFTPNVVDQRIRSTRATDAGKTAATTGFMYSLFERC